MTKRIVFAIFAALLIFSSGAVLANHCKPSDTGNPRCWHCQFKDWPNC